VLYKAFFGPLKVLGKLIELVGKVFKIVPFKVFGVALQELFSPCEKVGWVGMSAAHACLNVPMTP
jgi:hypothetical protein